MEKKFITKEQKEKVGNRLILNFAILLSGALLLLYVFNFNMGYPTQVKSVLGVLGIVFAVVGIAMLVFGFAKKNSKLKRYSSIFFGAFIPCALVSYVSKLPLAINSNYTTKTAVGISLILMLVYFVVLAIYTAVYLHTHPVLIEKKKIHHKKKK